MYSSSLEEPYPTSYQEHEQNSPIIPSYPKLSDPKGSSFRKKSFFYDPNFQLTTHTKGKPPYSYATLITYAINKSPQKRLSLNQLYLWLETHYPYLKTCSKGWKNSVRHNLSHNPTFYKVPRPRGEPGKGGLWTIDENMLHKLSCKTLSMIQVPQMQPSTPSYSPVSNSDESFGQPPSTAFARRSTVSDIHHPYLNQSTNLVSVPNLNTTRRHSQPMLASMDDYSNISTSYHPTGFISPSNPYAYPSTYMPYPNSTARLPSNGLGGNRPQVPLHPFGLMPNFDSSSSGLNLPYTYTSMPSQTLVLSSNIPVGINHYTDDSINYSTTNSPEYSQNPYELLTPEEPNYNSGFEQTTISPHLLIQPTINFA